MKSTQTDIEILAEQLGGRAIGEHTIDLTNYEEVIRRLDRIWTREQWENFLKRAT